MPTLGELRRLPPAEEDPAARGGGWNAGAGLLTGALVVAAGLAAGAGWMAANEPAPPEPFSPEQRQVFVEQKIDQMSPADLWRMQTFIYEPLAEQGLSKAESPADQALNQQIQQSRILQTVLLAAAAVAAMLGIAGYFTLRR